MPQDRTGTTRLAFNAGEWSPAVASRSDMEKAQLAARTLTNALVQTYGCATRRPGLRFVAAARESVIVTGSYLDLGDGLSKLDLGDGASRLLLG
jgi:hypothetical protein